MARLVLQVQSANAVPGEVLHHLDQPLGAVELAFEQRDLLPKGPQALLARAVDACGGPPPEARLPETPHHQPAHGLLRELPEANRGELQFLRRLVTGRLPEPGS